MRILAFSDVYRWKGYERLVDRYKPDVVVLAGDLISDGVAAFWTEGLELIPKFRRDRRALCEEFKVKTYMIRNGILKVHPRPRKRCRICAEPAPPYQECKKSRHLDFAFHDHLQQLENYHRKTAAFQDVHKRIHTEKFYRFLRYAGKRASVLVIKGNHDDGFQGDYDPERINGIPGCHEISGQTFEAEGVFFLGVSYQETAYRCIARSLLARFPQRGGIVISHARQRNVRLLAELRPRLIIRGHYGFGKFLLDGIPAVFTAGPPAVINVSNAGLPYIQLLSDWKGSGEIALTPQTIASIEDYFLKDYLWLAPYPPGR